MLFSGITSVCSPGLGFRSFVRSGGRVFFVSFRDGAVARIFYLLLVRVSPRRRWSSGIRLVLLPGCSVLSPIFHFLFASTVIMNPFNVGQDPANRTAFGFWGTKSGFVWDYSWTVITVLSQLWAYHIFVWRFSSSLECILRNVVASYHSYKTLLPSNSQFRTSALPSIAN